MKNKTDLFSVAEGCVNAGLPFALYAFPNEDEFHFEASLPDADACCVAHLDRQTWNGFAINFFGNDESYTAGVTDMIDLAEARDIAEKFDEKLYHPAVAPAFRSTPVLNYKASLHRVIDTLKKRGGKVVMILGKHIGNFLTQQTVEFRGSHIFIFCHSGLNAVNYFESGIDTYVRGDEHFFEIVKHLVIDCRFSRDSVSQSVKKASFSAVKTAVKGLFLFFFIFREKIK